MLVYCWLRANFSFLYGYVSSYSPVKWSWTVHEWFLNSSCAVHEHLSMNSSWTIHEHEMAKFMKLVRFMNLGVHKFEFMNLWVHELFMNYSSWIVHELLVHDLFMNNLKKWYMNSSWIVHEHLFMNSSWIYQLDRVMIMWPMIVMWSRPSPLPNLENLMLKSNIYYTIFSVKRLLFNLKYKTKDNLMPSYIF